ncbi:MAG: hypothetical protein EPN17_00945 [Methylobacter sp.]|nr:MAG: hypothetical protein EPN17_00945 [Methylobacter sp.]
MDEDDRKVIDALSEKIILLMRHEMPETYDSHIAQEAVLLAQHRLFGSRYVNALFIGKTNLFPAG